MTASRPHDDAHWMRRALSLARRYAGRTWPNPTVGACVVRDDVLLAEGVHERAGGGHAEVNALLALRERGIDPRGATVYVTLEPCHHQGRTPPCTLALRDAGVARVVYAVGDDTPRAHGGGGEWLRSQGIRVDAGPFTSEARELNHPFFETRDDDEVHVTVKVALTLDGRVAPRPGRIEDAADRRVTGERAHRRVHRMRAAASCVVVGSGTVEADRPRLDVRLVPRTSYVGDGPRPVVLDTRGRLDPSWLPGGTLLLVGPGSGDAARDVGVDVVEVELGGDGRLSWGGVVDVLASRGLGVVLVEAGPRLAASLIEGRHAHRFHLFLAPRLFGPEAPGLPALRELDTHYRPWRHRRVGDDLEWVLRRRDLVGV